MATLGAYTKTLKNAERKGRPILPVRVTKRAERRQKNYADAFTKKSTGGVTDPTVPTQLWPK